MAMAPPRPCSQPKCKTPLNCTTHRAEAWRTLERPTVKRMRGRALQRRRAQMYAVHPWCAICRRPILSLKGMVRDHPSPLAEGGLDDESNEQVICHACDRTKTRAESARGVARR